MTQYGGPPQPHTAGSSAEYHQGGPGAYPPQGGYHAPHGQHGPPSGPGAYADGSGGHGGQPGQTGERGLGSTLVAGAAGAMVGKALGFGKLGGMVGVS